MRRLFWLLVLLFLSVWIGVKISKDPGYAVFAYQNWSVEMPLWFAVLSMIIFLFLFYLVMRLFDGIDFTIYRWRNWLRWRKKYKSYSKTNRGLVELIEGYWPNAERYLVEGVKRSDEPLINFLAAAKAAHEQGAYERRDGYLRKAHQIASHAEIAIGLTQAQLQYEQGQLEQASATLERLHQLTPKHPFVLKLLEKVYIRLADWQRLINLLPNLKKANIVPANQLQTFEEHLYQELLRTAANKNLGWLSIQQAWQFIPKKFQKKPNLIAALVRLSLPFPEAAEEMEDMINQTLKKGFNKELVYLYGLLKTRDPQKQLLNAERWLKQYGEQSILLLTLGRLSTRCQQWAKAREYYLNSIKLEANAETYREYGNLLVELGELDSAAKNYRAGLELRESSLV